jgi:AraC family transcriptional regulator of adaptative response / DNA-3-methyladenine glycosylase II
VDAVIVPGLELDRATLDRARWSRDPRFDGRFYIAVLSTGVYCRPICPSPTAKSCNVRYYPTAAAAEEAGFRPCLRCRPEAAPDTPAWLGASAVVRRALRLIQQGALDDTSVEEFSERLGVGPRHLRRLFMKHLGASPAAVARTRRLHFAKQLIDETNLPMSEIAVAAGYGSVRRFNATIRARYSRTPSELRRLSRYGGGGRGGGLVLRLAYRPPYDWSGVLEYLDAHAIPGVEIVRDGSYYRTVVLNGKPGYIVARSAERAGAIELEVHGAPATELFAVANRARRMFDVSVDPAQIETVLEREPTLGSLVKRYPGVRIPGAWDGFECSVAAILSEGSLAAGRPILSRLVRTCGSTVDRSIFQATGLTHLFPTAQALATADLRGIGLSEGQILTVKALAAAYIERRVEFDGQVVDLTQALRAVSGVTQGVAQYVTLRALGHPDVFPVDLDGHPALQDPPRPGTHALSEVLATCRPWRSYAALCLWRARALCTVLATLLAPGAFAAVDFSEPAVVIEGAHSAIRLAVSPDGAHQLWGEAREPEDGGLQIRERRLADGTWADGTWSEAADVPFNTRWNDFDPAFAPDGSGVYFFSDRPGGAGGDDLWFVPLEGNAWGEPVNLGAPLNTPGNEWAPTPLDNGGLLFSSDGHGGLGGQDLYVAERTESGWGTPRNLGAPVNSPLDDYDAAFLADEALLLTRSENPEAGSTLLYSCRDADGYAVPQPAGPNVNLGGGWALGPSVSPADEGVVYFSGYAPDAPRIRIYRARYRVDCAPSE